MCEKEHGVCLCVPAQHWKRFRGKGKVWPKNNSVAAWRSSLSRSLRISPWDLHQSRSCLNLFARLEPQRYPLLMQLGWFTGPAIKTTHFLASARCWHANEFLGVHSASTPTSHKGRNRVQRVMIDFPWAAKSKVLWLKKKKLSLQDCMWSLLKLSDVTMGDKNGIGGIKNPSKGFVITLDARCLLWIWMRWSEGGGWWCYCDLDLNLLFDRKWRTAHICFSLQRCGQCSRMHLQLKPYLFLHSVACTDRLFAHRGHYFAFQPQLLI